MGKGKKITFINEGKTVGEVEMVCAFEVPELKNKYIIYSKNESDAEGNTIIYCGKLINKDDKQLIENIEKGTEWNTLKKVMKLISKYSLDGERNVY